jgi:hypothetical protein
MYRSNQIKDFDLVSISAFIIKIRCRIRTAFRNDDIAEQIQKQKFERSMQRPPIVCYLTTLHQITIVKLIYIAYNNSRGAGDDLHVNETNKLT